MKYLQEIHTAHDALKQVVIYVTLLTTLQQRSNYRDLRLHLPLLAWVSTGLGVLDPGNPLAFQLLRD
jgi:hypothetical protein